MHCKKKLEELMQEHQHWGISCFLCQKKGETKYFPTEPC
jgi:hypothetical protein